MRILIAALCLSLGWATTSWADDDLQARREIAHRYSQMALEDMDIDRIIGTMYIPVLDQLRAQGRQISDEQVAQLDALYQSEMRAPLIEIVAGQEQIVAELFTLEELEALEAFYASPVGRSVMRKMPSLMEQLQPQIMAMLQNTIPRMLPRMRAILEP